MSIKETLTAVLTVPSPSALWQLKGDLAQAMVPDTALLWSGLNHFYEFLNHLSASMSAHEYSKFATLLDIGAVGGVALERVFEPSLSGQELWKRLLIGGASESLMVLASRQYIKAFQTEIAASCRQAAWHLYQELWRLSAQLQPSMDPAVRRQTIDAALAPIHDDQLSTDSKALLICRLFQILLLIQVNGVIFDMKSAE